MLQALVARYPALQPRLFAGERLQPGLSVAVDGEMSSRLSQAVAVDSRLSIIPAMAGGSALVRRL